MIFCAIYILISLGALGSIMYFSGLYLNWYWYWIPIVGFPIFYALCYGLTLLPLFFIAKKIDIDKEVTKKSRIACFLVRQIDFLTVQLSLANVKYTLYSGSNGFCAIKNSIKQAKKAMASKCLAMPLKHSVRSMENPKT